MNPRVKAFWVASLLLLLLSYYLGLVNGYETGSGDSGAFMGAWMRVTQRHEAIARGEVVPVLAEHPMVVETPKPVNSWVTEYLLDTHRKPIVAATAALEHADDPIVVPDHR